MTDFDPSDLFRLVDVFGVLANGLLGGAIARKLDFDAVGFVVIAVVSGLGGGILRDILLNQQPVALTDPAYLSTSFVAAAISYLLALQHRWSTRTLIVFDLLALGAWAATGASKSLSLGLGIVPSVLLGVVTAVGGGVIRDNLVGRVPAIFGGNPLYATLAVLGASELVICQELNRERLGMALSMATCLLLGLAARRWGWMLPGALALTPHVPRSLMRGMPRSLRFDRAAARRSKLEQEYEVDDHNDLSAD